MGDNEFHRGKREKFTSTRHRGYIRWEDTSKKTDTSSVPLEASATSIPTSGTPYALSHYVNSNAFSFSHRHFLEDISIDVEPTSYKQAMNDPRWKKAMEEEIAAFEANVTSTVELLRIYLQIKPLLDACGYFE